MRILFVRHGEKRKGTARTKARKKLEDHTLPLRDAAKCKKRLVGTFATLDLKPEAILTSCFLHSRQTAEFLAEGHAISPIVCDTLIPEERHPLSIDALAKQVELTGKDTIVVVGHEPRLSLLIATATGKRIRPLEHLEVACLDVGDAQSMRLGLAELAWRYPVRAHDAEQLRGKITSKMTVATLLAGFTFVALLEALMSSDFPAAKLDFTRPYLNLNTMTVDDVLSHVAVMLLTTAVGFFIAAVYVYDNLAMPEGFWSSGGKAGSWDAKPKKVKKQADRDGLVYTHMIYAWTRLFTPAVVLAAVGFLLLAVWRGSLLLGVLFIIGWGVVWVWARKAQPRLGVD